MYHADYELFSEPLIDFLVKRGWTLLESEPDIAILRKFILDQEEEILLPRDRSYADYFQRVQEGIQFFAKCEHSSEKTVLEELRYQKGDVLRIAIRRDRIVEVQQNEFIGKICTLHGEPDEQGNMQGEATLVLILDDRQVKAMVNFGPEGYSAACDAHKNNRYIRISGILSERPRCLDLKDVPDFDVI